jgi:IS30 family transposase
MLFVGQQHEECIKMSYQRLSGEERRIIYRMLGAGCTREEIGRLLGRSKGTISREVKRNTGLRGYRPTQAHARAVAHARRPGPRRFTPAMRQEVEARIRQGQTPEIIQGRVRYEGRTMVCKETIYQHIYADAKQGGDLWENLPRAKRRRHRRCPRQDGRGRGRILGQRRIDTRPAIVATRTRLGDWEGDLMTGAPGTGHLVTMVERKSRFTLLGRTQSKEAPEVNARIGRMFDGVPSAARKSATFDNGKEFALHQEIARHNALEVYFAFPYHSWERGTNENTNGLIRRIYPKGSSFADLNKAALAKIDAYINDRPRKCLGWRTPREVFYDDLVAARSG